MFGSGVPSTPTEITNRLNEIACQNVLEADWRRCLKAFALTSYDADEALSHLPISSKFNGKRLFSPHCSKPGGTRPELARDGCERALKATLRQWPSHSGSRRGCESGRCEHRPVFATVFRALTRVPWFRNPPASYECLPHAGSSRCPPESPGCLSPCACR